MDLLESDHVSFVVCINPGKVMVLSKDEIWVKEN